MNPSTQSAQPWRSLNFVGITAAYSWAWGHNTHCWVLLHLLENIDIALPAGRRSWHWMIWYGGVQLKYNTGKDGIRPWKVLSRSSSSLCVYWTQLLSASRMISVSNRSRWHASGPGSDQRNGLVRFQNCPKTRQAASWRAKPWLVPVNLQVLLGLARPVSFNLRFSVSGFSIYGRI